jgi:hypothetical protein
MDGGHLTPSHSTFVLVMSQEIGKHSLPGHLSLTSRKRGQDSDQSLHVSTKCFAFSRLSESRSTAPISYHRKPEHTPIMSI